MRSPYFASSIVLILFSFCDVLLAETGTEQNPIWNETWTDKLKRDLFLKYDKFARPTQHYNTTVVEFDMSIGHVYVNEFRSTMTVSAWVHHKWIDEKLKWDPAKYGGLKQLHVGTHELWQPDLVLYNSGTPHSVEYYGDILCIISSDGSVLWVPPAQFISFCDLDLRFWPFDTQVCKIKLGSWTHHANMIDLRITSPSIGNIDLFVQTSEWKLVDVKKTRHSDKYPCCDEDYISLDYDLTLKRNAILYDSILMIPAIAIVFLTLVIFWLPPQSEVKVTVAACIALIIVIFLVYFGFKVPLTTNPPLIVFFYSGCLCQVTISLIVSVLVINMSRRTYCKPLPRNVKMCLLSWPGRLLGLSDLITVIESRRPMPGQELRSKLSEEPAAANSTSNISDDCDRQNIISPTKNATQLEWILAATAIDRIVFVLFCIILGTMAILCLS